jgi:phosphatidylinositol 4-kinase A
MFHTYLLSSVQSGDEHGHCGYSFLVDHPFAKKEPISKAHDELVVKLRDKANDMHDFLIRSHFLGEFSQFCFDSEAARLSYVNDISEGIFESLGQFVDISSSLKESRFRAVMCRATYAFIEDSGFHEEHLRDLVWIPVRRFTVETMEVAVKCWSWICSSRPELEVYILEQLIGAWNWTVEEGLGIFDTHNRTPLFCHKKWLEYLYERQIITGERSQEFHNLFASMVTTSLKAAPQMCRKIESLGMRSRLLNISFQLIHSKVAMNRSLFRRLAFNAAISWFENFPAWSTPFCAKHLDEDVQSILQLCQQLVVERAFLKREVDEVPVGDVFDVQLGEEHEEDQRSVLSGRMSHSKSGTTKVGQSKTSSVFRLDVERKEAMYVDFSGIILPRETLSLLLLLYGHELDRIEIYHNPQRNDHQRVVKTTKFTALIERSKSQWVTHVRTAWAHGPSIAVHLHTRFRNDHVYGEITRLVRDNHSMVPRYPHCIPFLATPENVAQDFHGLSVLLQCAPTDVLAAFRLLQYPMGNHPHVRRFAVDSLLQSEASELTTFLPQLIQMLEKEKWSPRTLEKGGLGHMLYTRACSEEDFAHLLLWCLRTEMENSGICGRMHEEIVRSFNPEQFEFYEKEFDFVDRVTNVSGFLKAIPKPERKGILESKISEMKMPECVYLPTHPGLSLKTIFPEKCFPMQSAAKVCSFHLSFHRQQKSD